MHSIGLLLLASAAFGRVGAIIGKVVNLPGDPVPNAPITATNVATKAMFQAPLKTSQFHVR